MSLLDLVQYAAGQQQRINRLVFGYILYNNFPLNTTDRKHRHWEKFRSSLWQKGFASFEAQERVQRGDNPLRLTTPETCAVITQPTTMPDAWVFNGKSRFLLRSEYYEAEKAVSKCEQQRCVSAFRTTWDRFAFSLCVACRTLTAAQENRSFYSGCL